MKQGKLVPQPWEYEEVNFSIREVLAKFALFYVFIFLPAVAIHEETMNPGATLNNLIRKYVYKQNNLKNYFMENPLEFPYDTKTPICDYKTMTPKQFFNEYVAT